MNPRYTLPPPENIESPAHRADAVFTYYASNKLVLKVDWGCQYMVSLNKLLLGYCDSDAVSKAYQLYYIPACRASINSLLLAGDTCSNIASNISEDEDTIHAYYRLFFDTSVFGNKLIRMAYIRQLPSGNQQEEFEKSLLIAAIQLGKDYIYWKLGIASEPSMSSVDMHRDVMLDSYWKFKELKVKAGSELTKEARAWIPAILSSAAGLDKFTQEKDSSVYEPLQVKLISIANPLKVSDLNSEIKG